MSTSSLLIPPPGSSCSPRLRLARASSSVACWLASVATCDCRSATFVFTSSMARSSWIPARPDLGHLARSPWPSPRQARLGRCDGRLADRELDLIRLPVELDQDVPALHSHVVVDEAPARPGRRRERPGGDVAIDVGVVGRDRIQGRLDRGNQRDPPGDQADDDHGQDDPLSPRMPRPIGFPGDGRALVRRGRVRRFRSLRRGRLGRSGGRFVRVRRAPTWRICHRSRSPLARSRELCPAPATGHPQRRVGDCRNDTLACHHPAGSRPKLGPRSWPRPGRAQAVDRRPDSSSRTLSGFSPGRLLWIRPWRAREPISLISHR